MFLGTSRARWAVVVTRTVSRREGVLLVWNKNLKIMRLGNTHFIISSSHLWLTDEGFPGVRVLTLPPSVRPSHHHSVRCHSSQATGLNHVTDALTWLLGNNALTEALHTLLIHQVLQSLKWRRNAISCISRHRFYHEILSCGKHQ